MNPEAIELSPHEVVQRLIDLYEKKVKPATAEGDLGDAVELGIAAENIRYLPHKEFEAIVRIPWALGIVAACATLAKTMESESKPQIQHAQEILENKIALYR